MSRIGKQNLILPSGVSMDINNNVIVIKGPKGEIKKEFNNNIVKVEIKDNIISSSISRNDNVAKSLWGTTMSHIENMINGVQNNFEKKLVIEGVGFKWDVKGDKLQLNVGFSHPVFLNIPKDVSVNIEKDKLTILGIDKEAVSLFAMQIKKIKPVEPYKGKGIRYMGQNIIRKQGKKSS